MYIYSYLWHIHNSLLLKFWLILRGTVTEVAVPVPSSFYLNTYFKGCPGKKKKIITQDFTKASCISYHLWEGSL